jgi:ribonuclease D
VPDAPPLTTADPAEGLPDLELVGELPPLIATYDDLSTAVTALANGRGPLAVDTERASGFRYYQRAYLLQFARADAGVFLIDPIACPDLSALAEAMASTEWILHAASQDLPCLSELGLYPQALFDTELAGRLLGMPRVGLATMVAIVLGRRMSKGHSAEDWSTRPLPRSWLRYAALDVVPLARLRESLIAQLQQAGKLAWAQQEFAHTLEVGRRTTQPGPDPWRRTAGTHRIRTRRGLALLAALWQARDEVARRADIAPGRILADSALVAAATALPRTSGDLAAVAAFHGRGASRHRRVWGTALQEAWAIPEEELPAHTPRALPGPPPARDWRRRDPAAAARLERARASLSQICDEIEVPLENLLSPGALRQLVWEPPDPATESAIRGALSESGARPWQLDLVVPALARTLGERPVPSPA